MTTPRSVIVNRDITRFYHVISRCVRRAHLCGDGQDHRKDWLETRLEELAGIFAIDVCGYAILDNHLHLLVQLGEGAPDRAWSAAEVARRWARLFPFRDPEGRSVDPPDAWIESRVRDEGWIETIRGRLSDLGWFMKSLKEPLARLANREDGCTGAFWEGRYRSIAILDEPSLVATCAYIDLNPVAAGLAGLPVESAHTSIRSRIEHAKRVEESGRDAGRDGGCDEAPVPGHWLCPLDRVPGDTNRGMVEGLDLGAYLSVVDWMARMSRPGKTPLAPSMASIMERIGIALEPLRQRVTSLVARVKMVGTVAGGRGAARAAAMQRGVPWVKNLWGALA